MMRSSRRRVLSACALGLASSTLMRRGEAAAAPAADAAPLRFGLTPVFLDERVRLLQRWREVLQALLGRPVEFVQRTTYGQVVDLLRTRQVDVAWLCGYPYVLHQRELKLVCVPVWRGRAVYQSYLITDATGAHATLESLRGRSFAYSDPLSNSGWLYMQHRLRSLGEEPTRFSGAASSPTRTDTSWKRWPKGWPRAVPWTATSGRRWPKHARR
jgi:phosphonate transport system substrate-binding protein